MKKNSEIKVKAVENVESRSNSAYRISVQPEYKRVCFEHLNDLRNNL